MNLFFRMLYVYFRSFFKQPLSLETPMVSRLTMFALPNDLDINLHMNNGRYLTICDLNRVDFFIRTDLLKIMQREKWIPLIAEHTMQYKKPLKLFQRFEVILKLTHWDDKCFHMQHYFHCGDKVMAEGTSQGVVRGKDGVIPPEEVMRQIKIYRTQKKSHAIHKRINPKTS